MTAPQPSFWSPDASAVWEYPLADGTRRQCTTTPRNLLRAIKRAIGAVTSAPTDDGRWFAPDSDALRAKARALGLSSASIPVSAGQTQWTSEMMQLALWVTYRQTGSPAGIAVPLLAPLPRSNATPPDDGITTWPPRAPVCAVVEPDPTPAPPAPGSPAELTREQVLARLQASLPGLDWQASNFSSGALLSARWGVRYPNGTIYLCASQARSVFILAKIALAVTGNVEMAGDSAGRWTNAWMRTLYQRAQVEWGLRPEEIPFEPDAEAWTRESLGFLLWGIFYRTALPSYTSLMLAEATVLPPPFGQVTPDDGLGSDPLVPLCVGVNLSVPVPPVPSPVGTTPQPPVTTLPPVAPSSIARPLTRIDPGPTVLGLTPGRVAVAGAVAVGLWWLFG